MNECYLNSRFEERSRSDKAFAGATHALSAVAVFFTITAFAPKEMYAALGTSTLWMIVLTAINTAGASLLPDADNTASTTKSSLGILGDLLSVVFRNVSVLIQTTIRTSRDSADPNPHRGAFHTIAMALILGFLVYACCSVPLFHISFPYFGKVSSGFLLAMFVTWMNMQMAMAGLFNQAIKGIRRKAGIFGDVATFALSGIATLMVFVNVKEVNDFWWLGVSLAAGMIIHIIGDGFTRAGVPLLAPIPHKGKCWWNYRFFGLRLTSGGVFEHYVLIPFFALVMLLSALRIFGVY